MWLYVSGIKYLKYKVSGSIGNTLAGVLLLKSKLVKSRASFSKKEHAVRILTSET